MATPEDTAKLHELTATAKTVEAGEDVDAPKAVTSDEKAKSGEIATHTDTRKVPDQVTAESAVGKGEGNDAAKASVPQEAATAVSKNDSVPARKASSSIDADSNTDTTDGIKRKSSIKDSILIPQQTGGLPEKRKSGVKKLVKRFSSRLKRGKRKKGEQGSSEGDASSLGTSLSSFQSDEGSEPKSELEDGPTEGTSMVPNSEKEPAMVQVVEQELTAAFSTDDQGGDAKAVLDVAGTDNPSDKQQKEGTAAEEEQTSPLIEEAQTSPLVEEGQTSPLMTSVEMRKELEKTKRKTGVPWKGEKGDDQEKKPRLCLLCCCV